MGFLNGVFLFALGAAVLPVVIHILNRRRLRKIRFSSLDFVEDLNRRRMTKVNVRRYLVLVLRTAAVVFLVVAFARPTIRGAAAFLARGGAPKNVIVCLDRSYSMGAEQEEGTAFSRAQEIAKTILDGCADRDIVNVVAFGTRAEVLFDAGTRNRWAAKKAVEGLGTTTEGTSFSAAIETAAGLSKTMEGTVTEVYVVSDFREGADTVTAAPLPEGASLVLVPVYEGAVDNVSIDRLLVPRKLVRPGEAVRIGVAVTNHSRERPAEIPLEILLDGKRRAQKLVTISPASSAQVTFAVSMTERGTYRGRVAKNRDRLPLDDDRYFVLQVSSQVPVTLVRGRALDADGGRAASFFVERALDPRRSLEGEFRVQVVDQGALAVSNLPDAGVVVWTDPESVDAKHLDLVRRYVHGGGSLLVFLGDAEKSAWRSETFARYLGIAHARSETVPEGVGLVSFAGDHPAMGIFTEEELALLARSRVTRYVVVGGISADSVLARFDRSGTPAIWECRRGRGRIVAVAASPDLHGGNLPLSPMFLPLVHATVSYLAEAGRAEASEEHLVGADLRFDVPRRWSAETGVLRVRTARGEEVPSSVRVGEDGRVHVVVPEVREVGFYTLVADTAVLAEAAVNVDTRESNLNPAPLDDLSRGSTAVLSAGADLSREIRRRAEGREVFVLFFALALAALVAEALLGRTV